MMDRINKAVVWTAENLNEYAALADAGKDVPGHSPSSPMFWFNGLARETLALWDSSAGDLLSPSARAKVAKLA